MAAQANLHPIFLNESWHGPSFTYLLAPPVVGLPLRPPPAPCCAVEKCFQNMPPILTWLIEGPNAPTHDLRWSRSIDDAWMVSAIFFFFYRSILGPSTLWSQYPPWKVNLYTNSAILNFNDTFHYNVILRYLSNISKAVYYMPLLGKILQI